MPVNADNGGQVASKLASLMMPDLLVLLVSLPDDLDIALLRDARIQTVIGWKVIRLFCLFPFTSRSYACRRRSTYGADGSSRNGWCGTWARQPFWLEGAKVSGVATALSRTTRSWIMFYIFCH